MNILLFKDYNALSMQVKLEGILISKRPFKGRNLVGTLLSRSGKKLSTIFYGGIGGGSKKKASTLELGFLLQSEISVSSRSSMAGCKEWKASWIHHNIREDHRKFYLLCFFFELIDKIALEVDAKDKNSLDDDDHRELFVILSNALFRLDQKEKGFNNYEELLIFLVKLAIAEGCFPGLSHCIVSHSPISSKSLIELQIDQGGFVAVEHVSSDLVSHSYVESSQILLRALETISTSKYGEIDLNGTVSKEVALLFWNYLRYHFQLGEFDLKSTSMIL